MPNSDLMTTELSAADVPDNVALSRSVGWKDVASEWRVLHAAARVIGVRDEQRLVAQGALGDYGTAASLAKMVVAPEYQRRGVGRQVLERLLSTPRARGLAIGLCATEQGMPLYSKVGFEACGDIMILFGTPDVGMETSRFVVKLTDARLASEIERRFVACDRGAMLAARIAESAAAFRTEPSTGYVMATRFDAAYAVGPLLAQDEDAAKQLALATFRALPGPIRIDVPLQRVSFRRWLVELGLREHGTRVEMVSGAPRLPWQVAERFALGTQAWG